MNLGQLRSVLQTAEAHYRGDGRGDIADALSKFSTNLLKGSDSQTVAAFVGSVQKAKRPAVVRNAGRNSRKRQTAQDHSG